MSIQREYTIYLKLANHLATYHPHVPYHFDFGSGLKMTMGQATKQKALNKRRGFPDLTIFKQRDYHGHHYCGMVIEIKAEGERIKKRDGTWASEHVAEQAAWIDTLRANGWIADFGVGYEESLEAIHSYCGHCDHTDGEIF
jgi:hypothetical protein